MDDQQQPPAAFRSQVVLHHFHRLAGLQVQAPLGLVRIPRQLRSLLTLILDRRKILPFIYTLRDLGFTPLPPSLFFSLFIAHPQDIVLVHQTFYHVLQHPCIHSVLHFQQDRLVIVFGLHQAPFEERSLNRGQLHFSADRSLVGFDKLRFVPHHFGQFRDGLPFEHLPRLHGQARFPGLCDDLDAQDGVTTQF